VDYGDRSGCVYRVEQGRNRFGRERRKMKKACNFGDLPPEFSREGSSKVEIIPVPYEATVTYRGGTGKGPGAIIEASRYLELYDEELDEQPYKIGIYTASEMKDLPQEPEAAIDKIYHRIKHSLSSDKFLIILGGEHSITVGAVRAFAERYPALSVLQLDAHADLRNSYEGSPYNHACVMRRVGECCSFVALGVRSLSKEEADYIQDKSLKVVSAWDLMRGKDWKKLILDYLSDEVYLTVDLDVLDPSIMPAVGTPEPGGLGWYEILRVLRYLAENKKVVGMDVVELSPLGENIAPDFLTARLIYKMIGYAGKSYGWLERR